MRTLLFQAVLENDVDTMRQLISSVNIDPNQVDEETGLTPLIASIRYGNDEAFNMLLNSYHADVDATGVNGFAPIHEAAQKLDFVWADVFTYHNVANLNAVYMHNGVTPMTALDIARVHTTGLTLQTIEGGGGLSYDALVERDRLGRRH